MSSTTRPALGVRYIIGKPFDVKEVPETNNLIVRYEDETTGEIKEEEFDLLVLPRDWSPTTATSGWPKS